MKITHIEARNYQRLTDVDIQVRAPLLLLAGENEQGKTSIADAVYHAINGVARRVALKKDFPELVNDGHQGGSVALTVIDPSASAAATGDSEVDLTVAVPSGKRTCPIEIQPLLVYLLDATLFPRLKPEEKRALLFGITGTRMSGKLILEKLREKGANPEKAAAVGAVILAGFAAAEEDAKKRAAEARGAWKATTNEVYGSKKAEAWKAEKPEYSDEAITDLGGQLRVLGESIAQQQVALGELNAQAKEAREQAKRRDELQLLVDEIPRRQAKLQADQELVDEWQAKVNATQQEAGEGPKVEPISCPHCGGLVELHDGKLVAHEAHKAGSAKARALLPLQRETLNNVVRARDNSKSRLEVATNAKAALDELLKNPAPAVSTEAIEQAQAAIEEVKAKHRAAQAAFDEQAKAKEAAQHANQLTTTAAGYHKDVQEWEAIQGWLAPSGIQAELLARALDPFTTRMASTAVITGWDAVTIDSEMVIRIGGRPFGLCSASAQWRAEATIAEAMAHVSGVRTFLLDEVELLIGATRLAFLTWMHKLAAAGEIDTAILIGSFREPPQCPPTFQVAWVKAGVCQDVQNQQEAA